jgi:hypothetical protein
VIELPTLSIDAYAPNRERVTVRKVHEVPFEIRGHSDYD